MSDTFVVYAGSEKMVYTLHIAYATKTSQWFRNELRDGPRTLYVNGFPQETFEVWAKWIYSGKLDFGKGDELQSLPNLVAFYALGEFLNDKVFRNTVMDATLEYIIQRNSLLHSPWNLVHWPKATGCMRELFARQWAVTSPLSEVLEWFLPVDFAAALRRHRIALRDDHGKIRYLNMAHRCEYHVHDEGEPRCN